MQTMKALLFLQNIEPFISKKRGGSSKTTYFSAYKCYDMWCWRRSGAIQFLSKTICLFREEHIAAAAEIRIFNEIVPVQMKNVFSPLKRTSNCKMFEMHSDYAAGVWIIMVHDTVR